MTEHPRHVGPLGRALPRRPTPRRLAAFLVCVLVAFVMAPTVLDAAEPVEVVQARERLQADRSAITAQLDDAEKALGAARHAIVETESALEDRRQVRGELVATIESVRRAREQPLELRRAIAIEVYVAGDPNATSIIDEIIDGNTSLDAVRDRALYSAVVDWATDSLNRFDTELERLLSQLDDVDTEIPRLESDLVRHRQTVSTQALERDALIARIAEVDQSLRALNRAILTGLSVDTVQGRPILVVKIDNVAGARPQLGVERADIVIEEKVEYGLTRLAALFQSTGSDPVGPIRSARTSDVHLFAHLGSPLFAYSGANFGVGSYVAGSTLIDVGATRHPGAYYRQSGRRAPHNLYSNTSRLWSLTSAGSPPQAIFEFRSEGEGLASGARPSTGVDVNYGSARASFTWDGTSRWLRTMDGRPHTVVGGATIAPENVVVRFVGYVPSPADARSPEAVVTGSGPLWVFSAGQVIVGRWEQPSVTSPTRWLDSTGDPIRLTPGRTWILLPSSGEATLR